MAEQGEDISRASIIHRLTTGQAEGLSTKAGPRWESPSLYRSILSDLLGLGHRPVVLGLGVGCGSLAVATASMQGIYIARSIGEFAPEGIKWASSIGAEVVEDDDELTADVALVDVRDVGDLLGAIETLGRRCASIVTQLPDGERVRAVLPEADLVRFRPRPYRKDEVLVVWRQK